MIESPFNRLKMFLMMIGDISIVIVAYRLSFFLRAYHHFYIFSDTMPSDTFHRVSHYNIILIAIQIMTLYFFGLYDISENRKLKYYLQNLFSSVLVCCLILVTLYYFMAEFYFPRSIFFLFGFINLLFLIIFRYFVIKVFGISLRPRNVIILGTNKTAKNIMEHMSKDRRTFNIRGFISREKKFESTFIGLPILGHTDDLMDVIKEYNIDEVVVAQTNSWLDDIIHNISGSDHRARLTIVPSPYEILIGKLKQVKIHDIPLIEMYKDPSPSSAMFIKRLFDIFISLFLLFLLSPLFAVIAVFIKATSKGSILFKQERYGKDRVPFTIFKFRTMVENAEEHTGPVLATERDERITPAGRIIRRLRLDELPQIMNILKGDMSFVGPRPERPFFSDVYAEEIKSYNARFKVKPGLTGLAQINGEYHTDPEIKLKYDLAYIYNQSILLDIIILTETVKLIFAQNQRK